MTKASFPRWVRALCTVSLVLVAAAPSAMAEAPDAQAHEGEGLCDVPAACTCPTNPQDYIFRLDEYIDECRN